MVAIARWGSSKTASPLEQEKFLGLLPLIRRPAEIAFRLHSYEHQQELVADVVASAFLMYLQLVQRGKQQRVFATPWRNLPSVGSVPGVRLAESKARQI